MLQNDSNFSGVFVNNATIASARSVSNEDIYKNGKPVDVGIDLELEIGKSFKPKMSIAGNLKTAPDGTVSWSSAMKVKIFLNDMKVSWKQLNPDNSIPQEILDQLIGKEITRLQYPYAKDETTGKNKYRSYGRVVLASYKDKDGRNAEQFLRAKYEKDVADGYVKPLADDNLSFPGAHEAVHGVTQDEQV